MNRVRTSASMSRWTSFSASKSSRRFSMRDSTSTSLMPTQSTMLDIPYKVLDPPEYRPAAARDLRKDSSLRAKRRNRDRDRTTRRRLPRASFMQPSNPRASKKSRSNFFTATFLPRTSSRMKPDLGAELAKDATSRHDAHAAHAGDRLHSSQALPGAIYILSPTPRTRRQHVRAHFRDGAKHAETWDAFTGEVTGLPDPDERCA